MNDLRQQFPPELNLGPNFKVESRTNQFWEVLESDGVFVTKRAKVPGGWLVQTFFIAPKDRDNSSVGPVSFVNDPYHEWYMQRNFD